MDNQIKSSHVKKTNTNNHCTSQKVMADSHPPTGAQHQGRSKKRGRRSKKPKEPAVVESHKMFDICISTPGQKSLQLCQISIETSKQFVPRPSNSAASSLTPRIFLKNGADGLAVSIDQGPIVNDNVPQAAAYDTDENSRASYWQASDSTGRKAQYDTDQTSQDGSPVLPERERNLNRVICQLQWDVEGRDIELGKSEEKYNALKNKYDKQISQRKADYEKLKKWCAQVEEAEDRAEELEGKVADYKIEQASTQERHAAALRAKYEEMQTTNIKHQHALDAMRNVCHKSLLDKVKEAEEAKALAAKAEEDLKAAHGSATTERMALLKELETERGISKSYRTTKENAETKIKELWVSLDRTSRDYSDASNTQRATITSLTERNQQLERQVQQISELLKVKHQDARNLHRKIDSNLASRKEAKDLRDTVAELAEHNECLLDRVQQMSDSIINHQDDVRVAHSNANHLQNVIKDREHKIERQRQQLRAAAEQLEERQGDVITAPFAALEAVERENDELREALLAQEVATKEAHQSSNKHEALTVRRDIELSSTELELKKTKAKLEELQQSSEVSMKELAFRRDVNQCGVRLDLNTVQALSWVTDMVEDFKRTQSEYNELQQEHQILKKEFETIDDRWDTKYLKAADAAMDWRSAYFDQQETTVKQLHDEIHQLKVANGEAHWIQSEQPYNAKVAELNAQPLADANDDEYVNPPIYSALEALRPEAAELLVGTGKVWEDRLYVPLSEQKALQFIEAKDRDTTRHTIPEQDVQVVSATAPNQVEPAAAYHIEDEERDSSQDIISPQPIQPVFAKALYQLDLAAASNEEPVAPRNVVVSHRGIKHRRVGLAAEPLVSSPRTWESKFARCISKDDYDELEDDNKVDFYNAYIRGN